MKRKLLNAALFGAVLVAAPVSTFVSCADYDADITALENEVSSLKDLVNQKEAAIKTSIAALEAQDKLLAEKDAALDKAVADCKTHCANEIAKCKSDCAAARTQLQAAIDELKAALAAAEKKHGEDVLALLQADKDLQNGIDAAKAYAEGVQANLDKLAGEVETLAEGLVNTQTDVQNLVEGLKDLKGEVAGVKDSVKKVADDLEGLKKYVDEKVDELKKLVNDTEAALKGQIAANTTLITNLTKTVEDNKAEFNTFKTKAEGEIAALQSKDAELAASIKDAIDRVVTLEDGLSVTQKDVMDLSDGLHELQTQVNLLSADVAKNTKALVDLAVRMVDAEVAIAEAVKNLGVLQDQFNAFKIAQADVDAAQDLALINAVAALTKAEGEYNFDNINKAYKSALERALEAAETAKNNAIAAAKNYADTNFYNKGKVDEFVKALEDADKKQDADFQAWQEQVLLPLFADVWAELLDENGDSRLSVLEEGLSLTQKDVMDLSDGLMELTTRVTDEVARIEEAYKAADAKRDADFKMWQEMVLIPAFADVYTAIAELGVEISKEVKGFVLEPASYYEGIQAIEGVSYEYHKWNVTDELNPVQDGDLVKYCPTVTAHYHVNPSAAVLSKDVANYSYAVLDRQNRGVNTGLNPVIKGVAQNGGMLDVTLSLDANANKTPVGHADPSEVTVMALQYKNPAAKAENQIVTSDYAVLYLNPLKEVSLVSATDTDHEITDVFAQVVPNNDQDLVEYTSSYDIQEQLAAKFGGENSVSMTELPEGFTVKYTPVYGDVTYFTPITADGKVTPQLPNGQPATTACVGKTATWRIDIMHGEDVVEVGFYKLTITGEAVVETAPSVVTEDILKITCEPTDEALNTNLSIENVWNKIAEVTGEELAVVKGKYSVTTVSTSEGTKVVQYKKYPSGAERELYKQYEGKGVIKLNDDGTVNWTVLDNDPYVESDLRSATEDATGDATEDATEDVKSMVTYIRVRSNDAISKDTYNEFYMPLVWTPKPIEFWGEYQKLSWTYTRVANQWQQSTNVADEKELRLYADLTKTGSTPFTYNIPEKAMVDFDYTKLEFQEPAKSFVNVANGKIGVTDGHFRFIEHPVEAARKTTVGGVDYVFTVSADGKQFLANDDVIATITEQGVVNLENNATSQLLLNAYKKDQLAYGETLCARVGFAAKCCAGDVKVINGDFDVRFIKPLTVNAADINISDADDIESAGKITTSILKNIVAFNDYTLAERPNYIDVFGVGIELGTVADWKTNYNAAADDFSKSLGDNHIAELFDKNEPKGEIIYINNTAIVSEFSVIVPVKVHYNWFLDPISVDIKLNVGRTKGNANRR